MLHGQMNLSVQIDRPGIHGNACELFEVRLEGLDRNIFEANG